MAKTSTTRRSTASRKTTTAKSAAEAETRPALKAVETDPAPAADDTSTLRKKELIDRVVETAGMKKKDVKPVVEAMLAVMGKALSEGETLNLPPLGKVMVSRKKDHDNGEVLMTRIRRSRQSAEQAAEEAKTPLAEPAEEG